MKKFIYIKLRKGSAQARVVGKTTDQTYPSDALSHPRTLVGDQNELIALFKTIIRVNTSIIDRLIKPKVLIHLVEQVEGGYTNSELYILREMALEAGAGWVFLCKDDFGPQPDSELMKQG